MRRDSEARSLVIPSDVTARVESERDLFALADAAPRELLDTRIAAAAEQVRAMALELGHGNVVVTCTPTRLRTPETTWSPFWSSLVHVLDNIVGHGVETEDERRALGKTPNVAIHFSARRRGRDIEVLVSDDGRGVDWETVRTRARALDLPHATRADLERALFAEGLTTRDRRDRDEDGSAGVGMNLVQRAVHAVGGRVEVASERGLGTLVRFVLPARSW